jgi:hypothetical protein
MTDRTQERIRHLVDAHGCHEGAFRTSNFPGYVDMSVIVREVRGSLHIRANGWQLNLCDTCQELAEELA